jgi:hypothetical protein
MIILSLTCKNSYKDIQDYSPLSVNLFIAFSISEISDNEGQVQIQNVFRFVSGSRFGGNLLLLLWHAPIWVEIIFYSRYKKWDLNDAVGIVSKHYTEYELKADFLFL